MDGVIEKLKEYNYVNDLEYATSLAASKLRSKPIGKHRLIQDLRKKKLDQETIEQAVERAFEEVPESSQIERAVEKRLRIKGKPETPNEQKNFFAYLMRQGFNYDDIRDQMEKLRFLRRLRILLLSRSAHAFILFFIKNTGTQSPAM